MKKCKEEKNRRLETTEESKKKPDVITKARNKLITLSDSLKSTKHLDLPEHVRKGGLGKSMTQVTLDYFFKHFPPNKNHVYANTRINNSGTKGLQKQNSIGSYPIRIEVTDEDDDAPAGAIERLRPTTVCVDKLDCPRDTDALALERPKKKLSFNVPEITRISKKNNKLVNGSSNDKSGSFNCISQLSLSVLESAGIKRNSSFNGVIHSEEDSLDNDELEV